MIENLFIVTDTGICIFAYHAEESSRLNLDENLVSGFLSAITQFSRETFNESILEKVEISRKKKIVVYNPPREETIAEQEKPSINLRIYAVTNFYDHDRLIKGLLREIFTQFHKKFKNELIKEHMNEFSIFDSFSKEINQLLADKIYPRTRKQSRLGFLVSLVLIVVLLLFLFGENDYRISEIRSSGEEFYSIDQIFEYLSIVGSIAAVVMFGSGFLGGYIAGSRKNAIRMGFTLAAIAFALIILTSFLKPTFFGIAMMLLVYLGLIGIVGCYVGGSLRDLRSLWPVEASR